MSGGLLREFFIGIGIQLDQGSMAQAEANLSGLTKTVRTFAATLAGSYLISKLGEFSDQMVTLGSNLNDQSQRLGVSATDLYAWQRAANDAGVQSEAFNASMLRFARFQEAARGGNANAARSFRQLGVSIKNADGTARPLADVFTDAGVAISRIPDAGRRASMSMQLFGRSGAALIPLFADGGASIAEMRREIGELYGNDLNSLAGSADATGDNIARFGAAVDALKVSIAVGILPAISSFINNIISAARVMRPILERTSLFRAALIVLPAVFLAVKAASIQAGIATLIAWLPTIGMFVAIAIAAAALIIIVEDIVTGFTGGKSVIVGGLQEIGAYFAEVFADMRARAVEFVQSIGEGFAQIWMAPAEAWNAFKTLIFGGMIDLGMCLIDASLEIRDTITGAFVSAFASIVEIFQKIEEAYLNTVGGIINSVADFIGGGLQVAGEVGMIADAAGSRDVGAGISSGPAPGIITAPSRGGASLTMNANQPINITQLPGEDSNAFAERTRSIVREENRRMLEEAHDTLSGETS
jgi:hypothetical protein